VYLNTKACRRVQARNEPEEELDEVRSKSMQAMKQENDE
jgi:hypothetical protein